MSGFYDELNTMEQQTNRAEELAAQYQAGSRQAMEDLIQEIQDKVYYHCVKILRNENDAQDAAQDVLMAVVQGLDGLKNPSAFYAWLNRIIARTCMKTYAREHREVAMSEGAEEPFFEDLDDQQIPEKVIDTEETRKMIRELVDELPPAQRLCVLMYYYDELPVKDIAEAMGAPENTVKSRLSYARRAIKAGVDRWTAQGLTLYSFTPLPYHRYFLQKESEDSRLPPVIVLRIQEALLAAGTAAAAASDGGILAGGSAAVAGLLHKGAIALTGLLLAGSVGGLLLHHPSQQTEDFPDPPRVVETLPMPVEPEAQELQTLSPVDEPVPQTAYTPVLLPAEKQTKGSGGKSAPTPRPEENQAPEPEPDSEPDTRMPHEESGGELTPTPPPEEAPEPEPDSKPDPAPRKGSGSDSDEDTGSEPVPPDPSPPAGDFYLPNYDFGYYLGKNEAGVHEFEVSMTTDRKTRPYPLLAGAYYTRTEISDESRVGHYAGYIYGIAPGKCDVRYYASRNPDGPFELAAIAYVTVEPKEPVTPDYDWGVYERTLANIAYFRHTLVKGGVELKNPLRPGEFYVKAVSGSPDAVEVYGGARLRAVGAGTATVRYYTRWTENDPWVEAVVAEVTVLEEAPPQAEVVERQTLRVRYGCNESFFDMWQGDLPQTLRFTSSKPSVVYVQPEVGAFSALSPGTAELTAYEPLKPDLHYVLEVQVDDAFAWEYTVEDMALSLGETQEQEIQYTVQTSNEASLSFISINSADRNIADVVQLQNDLLESTIRFEILGRSQGTVEVTGKAAFEVITYDGLRRMETTFSFQVQVNEPPEDDIPTVRKELEQFGVCSGYGYTGRFPALWDGELPEGLTYFSSNPAVACISDSGTFTTLSAGTVELTATSTAELVCRYVLTLHVQDQLECVRTMKEVTARPEFSNSAPAPNYELFSSGRLTDIQWTSSDPEILTVIAGSASACSFKALRVGTAALNGAATFMIQTSEGNKFLKDEFSLPVTVDYYMETEAVEPAQFGFCSGYGYTGSLQDYFPDLPAGLTFSSSDSSIASIHRDGRFTTLKTGRVVLTAYTEFSSSGHQYAVWLNVQDAMDWVYSLEGVELDAGGSVLRGVTDPQLNSGVELRYAYWAAADSSVASVTKDEDDPLLCRVEAKQPGTTMVTGWLTIQAPTYLYGNVSSTSLSATVSFPVTVREPEEANPDPPPGVLPSEGSGDEGS